MEQLCVDFERSTQLHVYNPTPFHLYIGPDRGVHAGQKIPAYTCIGELLGEPTYIWDMTHQDYIIVGDEFVLDVSKLCPRPILSWLREENQCDMFNNCIIKTTMNEQTGDPRFFLFTIAPINEDDELIYSVVDYMYQ